MLRLSLLLLSVGFAFAYKEGGYYYPLGARKVAFLDVGYTWNAKWNDLIFGDVDADPVSYNWPGPQGNDHLYRGGLWIGARKGNNYYVSASFYEEDFESCGQAEANPSGFRYVGPGKSAKDVLAEICELPGANSDNPIGVRVFERTLSWPNYPYNMFFGHEYFVIFEGSETYDEVYVSVWFDADVCRVEGGQFWYTDMVAYDGLYNSAFNEDPRYATLEDKMGREDEWTILADTAFPGSDGVPDGYFVWGDELEERLISANAGFDTTNLPTLPDGRKYMYIIPNNMSYIYTDPSDEETYNKCGYIFASLIYADPNPNDSIINAYGAPGRIVRAHSHGWWTIETDPDAAEIYQFQYQAGNAPGQFNYRFGPKPLEFGSPYFDYRFLLTAGPYYNVGPGDTLKFVFITGVGKGLNGGPNPWEANSYFLGIRQLVQYGYRAYYSGSQSGDPGHPTPPNVLSLTDDHWKIPIPPPTPSLSYSARGTTVDLVWDNIAEVTPDVVTGELDFAGYLVVQSTFIPTFILPTIDENGAFNKRSLVAVIFREGLTNTDKESILQDLFGMKGISGLLDSLRKYNVQVYDSIVRKVSVENLSPGFPYYFAVGAFDYTPGEIKVSQVSAFNNYKKNIDNLPVPIYVYTLAQTDWMDKVRIVPNPFKGSSVWSANKITQEIEFQYLPPSARIDVFTINGDHVITLYHRSASSGSMRWNLLTKNGNIIAPGIYMVKISDDKGNYKILKLMILR